MKLTKKLTTGIVMSASALALAGCSTGTIEESATQFDDIDSGQFEVAYEVDSDTFGEYGTNVSGQFEYVGEETEEGEEPEETEEGSDGEEESETSEEDSNEEDSNEEDSNEAVGLPEEEKDPARDYNYQIVEENRVFIDGQETTSTGEIIAVGDKLYDKVFLTGSEADGRFVYDSRDEGITEYPIGDLVTISPIIEAFNLEGNDIEVSTGDLHNGETGHVFTVTPEQAVSSLQEVNDNDLTQNILGLVTETNVDTVVVGVNENTFSVQAISTGATDGDENTTSETDTNEGANDGEERVIGSLVITKTPEDVNIEEPTNAMDLDEFSSLVELFYQQQAEQQLENQLSDDELYLDEEATEELEQEPADEQEPEGEEASSEGEQEETEDGQEPEDEEASSDEE